MSQYKDSRPLNVDFDYDSLDILCPTTIQNTLAISGATTVTGTLSVSTAFTQNTWPRAIIWTFPANSHNPTSGVQTIISFATPTIATDEFTSLTPALTLATYLTLGANTVTVNSTGIYHIELRGVLNATMGATQDYTIYYREGGVITDESQKTHGLAGTADHSIVSFKTTKRITSGTVIDFQTYQSEAKTWSITLSVIKLR